jgi:hypothetical protein
MKNFTKILIFSFLSILTFSAAAQNKAPHSGTVVEAKGDSLYKFTLGEAGTAMGWGAGFTPAGTSGQIMFTNGAGGAIYKDSVSSGRITNFLNGFTGTTPNWAYGTQTTLNIPLAGTTVGSGTVSNGVQSISGNKTFSGQILADSGLTLARRLVMTPNTLITASASIDLNNNTFIPVDATSGAVTLTFSGFVAGVTYTIEKRNSTTNVVTLTGGTWDGNANKVLYTKGAYRFIYNGTTFLTL